VILDSESTSDAGVPQAFRANPPEVLALAFNASASDFQCLDTTSG
jgi:hypothetical protein